MPEAGKTSPTHFKVLLFFSNNLSADRDEMLNIKYLSVLLDKSETKPIKERASPSNEDDGA